MARNTLFWGGGKWGLLFFPEKLTLKPSLPPIMGISTPVRGKWIPKPGALTRSSCESPGNIIPLIFLCIRACCRQCGPSFPRWGRRGLLHQTLKIVQSLVKLQWVPSRSHEAPRWEQKEVSHEKNSTQHLLRSKGGF